MTYESYLELKEEEKRELDVITKFEESTNSDEILDLIEEFESVLGF